MHFGRSLMALAFAAMLLTGQADAQSALGSVTEHLDEAAEWIDVEAREQGSLAEDDSATFTAWLSGNDLYWIGAVCDTDCTSVNIEVSGEDFYVDVIGNQTVSFGVWIPEAGTYSFTVTIWECSTSICYWGAIAGIDWMMMF